MKRLGLLAFSVLIFGIGAAFAQSPAFDLTDNSPEMAVKNARIEWVWIDRKEDENISVKERKLFLSFERPQDGLKYAVQLRAFNPDGSILGQTTWCSKTIAASSTNLKDQSRAAFVKTSLEVDPTLQKGTKFELTLLPSGESAMPPPETCSECAQTAGAVCGSKGIKSMTCGGTSGTCTFVCRD